MSSKIADFASQQTEYNDRLSLALCNLRDDIKHLKDTIETLQNTPGVVTAEDQALLDKASARSKALVAKFTVLDELTPPKVPCDR